MTPRAAVLLRQLSALMAELADELAGEAEVANDVTPLPRSIAKPKQERRPRALTRPDGEATPLVTAQAARILRDRGFR